ncbi:hypothetical protein GPECTOR_10g900 [Gonium pectorale]|uniref:PWWP domain-containing protein n=1 Tax=Gonium pectorale TaxID=33097 RepID=A0A150GR04_GONPE|nr:hypothetical protein GPECTOR_10g900 [Gonium pectorale]|eukprot:KXZ52269.1 hypothetical protein GPECTOR_10g900 [Gonium pectorale]
MARGKATGTDVPQPQQQLQRQLALATALSPSAAESTGDGHSPALAQTAAAADQVRSVGADAGRGDPQRLGGPAAAEAAPPPAPSTLPPPPPEPEAATEPEPEAEQPVHDLSDAAAFAAASRMERYRWLAQGPLGGGLTVGTSVWVKVEYYCPWPAVVFSLQHCLKTEVPDLLASYSPGEPVTLVHFYGEHNHCWVPTEALDGFCKLSRDNPLMHKALLARLAKWAQRNKRDNSVAVTLQELDGVLPDPAAELLRVCRLRDTQLAAADEEDDARLRQQEEEGRGEGGGGGAGAAGAGGSAAAGPPPRSREQTSGRGRDGAAAGEDGDEEWRPGQGRAGAAAAAAAAAQEEEAAGQPIGAPWRRCLHLCAACGERGGQVRCRGCRRAFHTLCLPRPHVCPADLPPGYRWACCKCAATNTEDGPPHKRGAKGHGGEDGGKPVPDGLTPDSVIYAAAFDVFQLQLPTADMPYIPKLLDPCTNCKRNPNIPAEKLYDIHDNGLLESNSWEGHYVILNPAFVAEIQWRFINRAIDEVERGRVPSVILVCRNSTDTAFFQRLRPYPRVLMRRTTIQFKDYPKTPIGFGIVVFCLAGPGPQQADLYRRFVDAFSGWGEPNLPIDRAFMESPEFTALLARLTHFTQRHLRDTWVQCATCDKWRIVPYDSYLRISQDPEHKWTCADLGPGGATEKPAELAPPPEPLAPVRQSQRIARGRGLAMLLEAEHEAEMAAGLAADEELPSAAPTGAAAGNAEEPDGAQAAAAAAGSAAGATAEVDAAAGEGRSAGVQRHEAVACAAMADTAGAEGFAGASVARSGS